MKIVLALCLLPLVLCSPRFRFNASYTVVLRKNVTNVTYKLYNPFSNMNIDHNKIYLIGAAFVILFVFIKLGSEREFNYCFLLGFKGCDYGRTLRNTYCGRKKCLKHKTSAGSLFPEGAFLVTSGIIPAAVMLSFGIKLDKAMDPKIVFNFLLIPIIMAAGWNTDKKTFYNNIGTILWFAIFGTIFNAAILMPFFYYGSKSRWGIFSIIDMDLLDSGLFAILICAVDPVAVLSVFESMNIDKLVYSIVFGESLLNDGVAVVFYQAFNGMKVFDDIIFFQSVGILFLFFIYAFFISILLAIVMAILISLASKLFYHHQQMQFVVILSINYFTYMVADSIKGSGILSLYFCVLLQRQYVQANLTYTTNTVVSQLLNQLALLSEGVIFILMGLASFSSTGISANTDVGFSLFLIFICYVSRYLVVYSLGFIANCFRHRQLHYKRNLFIQSHGGLRGAIGFSLALAIDERFQNKYYYQNATAIMVFFSVFILGATIKPLINLCKIPIESDEEKTVFDSFQDKVLDRTADGISAIIGSTSMRFKWEMKYRYINNRYLKKWFMAYRAIERNVSHSSVVKLYHTQRISEAHSIADFQSNVKETNKFDNEQKKRLYGWNSCLSLDMINANGRLSDEAYSVNGSKQNVFVPGKMLSERDLDDQVTHHNKPEAIGRISKTFTFMIIDKEKLKKKLKHGIDHHRSHQFKQPARLIDQRLEHYTVDFCHGDRNRFKKKIIKSVTFDGTFIATKKRLYNCSNGGNFSLSELDDIDKVVFSLSDDSISNSSFANDAYDGDDMAIPMETNSRRSSDFDPYIGKSDDSFNSDFELPWQRPHDHCSPERSHEPVIPGLHDPISAQDVISKEILNSNGHNLIQYSSAMTLNKTFTHCTNDRHYRIIPHNSRL